MARIDSLDVLRGVAITIMLLLDAFPDRVYSILMHAEWTGMTITDTALPMFAFAMGASATISMSRRKPSTKKILRRAAIIFAIGFFLNILPYILMFVLVEGFTLENFFENAILHGRFFGILQRLALTYAFGIFLARAIRNDIGIFLAALILLMLSSTGYHIYAPENPFAEEHNISRAVDYIFPGANHIYTSTHDPEGLYGSLAGTASVLFGFLAGRILIDNAVLRDKIFLLGTTGIVLLIVGGLWSSADVISKKLWTTPYALINAGLDFIFLVLFMKIFETLPRCKKFFHPLKVFGMNPLFFFIANNFMIMFLFIMPSGDTNAYLWIYQHTLAGIISTEFSATLFCVIWCLLWLPLAEIFYRLKIVIKI